MTEDPSAIEKFRSLLAELGPSAQHGSVQGTQAAVAHDDAQQAVLYYGTQKNDFSRGSDK